MAYLSRCRSKEMKTCSTIQPRIGRPWMTRRARATFSLALKVINKDKEKKLRISPSRKRMQQLAMATSSIST